MLTKEQKKLLGKLYVASKASVIQDIEDNLLAPLDYDNIPFSKYMHMLKYLERIMKRTTQAPRPSFLGLVNQWARYDAETWRAAWLVEGTDPDEVIERMGSVGFNTEGYYCGYAGGGFSNPMHAKKVAYNRILVTQWGGLDV